MRNSQALSHFDRPRELCSEIRSTGFAFDAGAKCEVLQGAHFVDRRNVKALEEV